MLAERHTRTELAATGTGTARRPPDLSIAVPGLGLRMDVAREIGVLEDDWRALEAAGRASLFQTFGWLSVWSRTAARHTGERPVFALVRDGEGRARAALAMAVRVSLGAPLLGWLGQSHAGYGLGVMDPLFQAASRPGDMRSLLAALARGVGAAGVHLAGQPQAWNGIANPFAAIAPVAEANDSWTVVLEGSPGATFEERFSARSRATLRRKARRLAELGSLAIAPMLRKQDRIAALEAFLEQKSLQLAEQGAANIFATPGLQAFYRHLASERAGPDTLLDIAAVTVGGGMPLAVLLSARAGDRGYLLNTSVGGGEHRAYSPGALLLEREIAERRRQGAGHYDFGPGDASYKRDWGAQPVPLVTSRVLLDARAVAPLVAQSAIAIAKRSIKRSPRLWQIAQSARRSLLGNGPVRPPERP